jgi:DIS3-like exonuclease 2
MQNVIAIAKESVGFVLDGSSSQALQESLSTLGRECTDQLAMQCVTELLMTPMRPAEYIAAGEFDEIQWRHFALNIPYYTHFTSPIRRYADILVHRLLQATLDEEDGVNRLSLTQSQLQSQCEHCNDLRMAAKKAQERSDRIFLSLFLREHPARCLLAVILSIGEKTFTVFVPSLALTTKVFLDDHVDEFDFVTATQENRRSISMRPKGENLTSFDLHIFMKLAVSCHMKPKPPLDVQVMVIGPWSDFSNESSDEFRGTLMNIY